MTDFLPQNDDSWNQVAGGWRWNSKGGTEHVYDTLKTGHGEEEESEKMDLGEKKGGSLCLLIELWFTYTVLCL